MIKSSDLRMGNWISSYAFWGGMPKGKNGPQEIRKVKVDVGLLAFIDEHPFATYDGIPLTTEILEKAGFVYRPDTAPKRWNKPMIGFNSTFYLYEGLEGELCFDPAQWNWTLKIKYVHQLQNLYFALTGEELKIEL